MIDVVTLARLLPEIDRIYVLDEDQRYVGLYEYEGG